MKATELMIGDWINAPIGGNIQILDFGTICSHDEFEPIPLTEEIMKANGFKYTEFQDGMFSFKREWIIIDDNNKYHTFVIRIVGANEYMVFDYVKIKYINELQHALRLCGLSDLADNFKLED